jgi:hypothetical protein
MAAEVTGLGILRFIFFRGIERGSDILAASSGRMRVNLIGTDLLRLARPRGQPRRLTRKRCLRCSAVFR